MLCSHFVLVALCANFIEAYQEPTRPVDLWNPQGLPPTTPLPSRKTQHDVIVKLRIGDIAGRKIVVDDLPWTANHDPLEDIPFDRSYPEPNPVPKKNNVTVLTFLGIPYAERPTGQRRFTPPQEITRLPGDQPYPALEFGPTCMQDVESRPNLQINDPYPYTVDEDCLYLNVFTPDASAASNLNYPVVVFFHGGNFQTGSSSDWPGHILASRGLVVVTVNYRLGAFGFLSLGDRDTGNYGLQDQRAALAWVYNYIASFGGDPQAVTVIGHDAGAVSVGLHTLSPFSKNLFRSVVAMSGADVSYHSTILKPTLAYNNTLKLGRYLGCAAEVLATEMWSCILTRSSNDIINAIRTIPIEYNRYLFLPNVDGWNIPNDPWFLLLNAPDGRTNIPSPVPYLTGLNKQDGVEAILEDRTFGEFNDFSPVDPAYMRDFIIEYAFRHNYTMNREAIVEAIQDYYTYWPDPSDSWNIRQKFIDLTTDAYYTSPVAQAAHLRSAAGHRVFMYVNNYNFSKRTDGQKFFPDWMGVCHECDLYLMFGFPFMPKDLVPPRLRHINWTDTDRNASQTFGLIIRQFVKNQDPNFPSGGSWSAHQPRAHWYMDFNFTAPEQMKEPGKLKRDYRWEEVSFWNEYVPRLVSYMTTTFAPEEVRTRRELVAFKIIVGILVFVLMVAIVLMLSFGYCLFDRSEDREEEIHRRELIHYKDQFPMSASQSNNEMHHVSSI
ncbi:hypothetical protein QR680_018777 [Steinernema hermaphroditum]|uniref:Carboxylesterase type B domain-containing protein n=1 Tax=Steinernema hermaphroditum TaxID=289476 RepID=A0AA39LRJ0_9BILA|nr:hypothetical protein QR680_018777 [Steinernema hermaphroditum]